MIQVYKGQTQKMVGSNINVVGVKGYFYLTGANSTAVIGDFPINWADVGIKVMLKRNGVEQVTHTGQMDVLGRALNFFDGEFTPFANLSSQQYVQKVLQELETDVKPEIIALPFYLPFKGIFNLDGDDQLKVEVTLGQSVFQGNVAGTNDSYLQIQFDKGIGYEYATPFVITETIQQGATAPSFTAGDGVTQVFVINTQAQDANYEVEPIWSNLNISTDKIDDQSTFAMSLVQRDAMFQDETMSYYRGQNFCLLSSQVLNNSVKISLTAALGSRVAASANYFVAVGNKVTKYTAVKAAAKQARHQDSDIRRIG